MRLGIIINVQRPKARPTLESIRVWANDHEWPIVECREIDMATDPDFTAFPADAFSQNIELLLALGGDGTMLTAARAVAPLGIPVLGINLGKLGFLTVDTPAQCVPALDRIRTGDYVIEDRLMLEVGPSGEAGESWFALNDVVLTNSGISRMITFTVSHNGEYVSTMAGDGIIVATPTGSTAYSLSVGGPIIMPAMRGFILTPVSPHTLAQRPMVFDESAQIEIRLDSAVGEAILTVDGQLARRLEEGSCIHVRAARHSARLISFNDRSFFKILREKLRWGLGPAFCED